MQNVLGSELASTRLKVEALGGFRVQTLNP